MIYLFLVEAEHYGTKKAQLLNSDTEMRNSVLDSPSVLHEEVPFSDDKLIKDITGKLPLFEKKPRLHVLWTDLIIFSLLAVIVRLAIFVNHNWVFGEVIILLYY